MSAAMDYPKSAVAYDEFSDVYRRYSNTKRAYIQSVDDLIVDKVNAAESILDFGSGDGYRGVQLKKRLHANRLIQVDVSEKMLDKCRLLDGSTQVINANDACWYKNIEGVDLVIALWNVLGHIETVEARRQTVALLLSFVKPGGFLVFDVNNRHNIAYGRCRTYGRRIIDRLWPDVTRGDAHYDWNIEGKLFPSYGHLFTPREIVQLLQACKVKHYERCSIDYVTGAVSKTLTAGQMCFVVQV